MAVEVLGTAWAKEWKKRLDASPAFSAVAAGWSGSLMFIMVPEEAGSGQERAVFLAVEEGRCRIVRPARPADRLVCDLILSATADTWRGLLSGSGDPLLAILLGKIRFQRGRWSDLVPYAQAARELLRTAASIEASFPDL